MMLCNDYTEFFNDWKQKQCCIMIKRIIKRIFKNDIIYTIKNVEDRKNIF